MKPFLSALLLTMTTAFATSAIAQATNDVENVNRQVKMTIAGTNSVFQVPTNIFISVSITNTSTNGVGVAAPVCDFQAFEVWLTDAVGKSRDIGFKRKVNGPGASGSGMNYSYEIYPCKSIGCVMKLPLDSHIQPGKYTLRVKRWCVVYLKQDANGKVISDARRRLVSNPIPLEVR